MKCASAYEFLSHIDRPHTLKEIEFSVDKASSSIQKELQGLLKRKEVQVVTISFNSKEVPFYTLAGGVRVTVIHHGRPFGQRTKDDNEFSRRMGLYK